MTHLAPILDFSHQHCIAICALLVPLNLLTTLGTLVGVAFNSSRYRWQMACLAFLFASLMILHVLSWLVVGVIMAPSFILFGLGVTCLLINSWAMIDSGSLHRLLQGIWRLGRSFVATIG